MKASISLVKENSISHFKSLLETKADEGGKVFPSQIPDERNPSITGKGIKNSLQHFPVHCTLHRQIVLAYIQHLLVNLLHAHSGSVDEGKKIEKHKFILMLLYIYFCYIKCTLKIIFFGIFSSVHGKHAI